MADSIRVLPEEIANQIAAGEVVERPASVVKELVENSIDAGAKKIQVWTLDGGQKEIRVRDDGHGISHKYLPLAFSRYATSKIRDVSDLDHLRTMGFRGEALASIASVSRCRLITRTADNETGHSIQLEGMEILSQEEVVHPPGTEIFINNLFFNVPARLKYLKKQATEYSKIQDTISVLALSRPDIHFELFHQDKRKLFLPPRKNLIDRISDIFGSSTAKEMVALNFETDSLTIHGFAGKPGLSRSNRRLQYFFVNGRCIQKSSLSHALSSAYRGILESGRYPLAVVYVSLPSSRVDVNVHPQKKEVRFLDDSHVYRALHHTVREAITHVDLAPRVETVQIPDTIEHDNNPAFFASPFHAGIGSRKNAGELFRKQIDLALEEMSSSRDCSDSTGQEHSDTPHNLFNSALHLIGQFGLTYIFMEDGDELLIYDQHTTHERILYERIMGQFQSRRIQRQGLLVPITLEVGPADAQALVPYLPHLHEMGFEVEEFGALTYIVRAVPGFLGRRSSDKRILFDILDDVMVAGKNIPKEKMLDSLVNIMACRAAVKSGDRLLPEEMRNLVTDVQKCNLPYTCPHGRPVMIRLHKTELDKRFHRPIHRDRV